VPQASLETLALANAALEVFFDDTTGAIVRLVDVATGEDLLAAPVTSCPVPGTGISVFQEKGNLGGAGLEVGTAVVGDQVIEAALESATADEVDGEQRLLLTIRSGDWRWIADYRIDPQLPVLTRRFRVENAGDERQVLRGAAYQLPFVTPGPAGEVVFAGNIPMGYQRLGTSDAVIQPLDMVGYRPQHGLVFLWSSDARRGIGAWYYSEDEYSNIQLQPAGDAASVVHQLQVLAPLAPGEGADLMQQFLWIGHGSRDDVLRSVRSVHAKVALRAPERSLARLREKVIYCGHPGGLPEQYFTGFGGIRAMTEYVPTLKRLGVDILWLMPVFEHGNELGFNLYSPFNHADVGAIYGTRDDLDELIHALRSQGMDVIFDVVPHGPPAGTPQADQYPQFAGREEDGSLSDKWGCLVFDNANPEWQQLMADEVASWAGPEGLAGIRIDVAGGSPPNWSEDVAWRPSQSTFHGGLGMMRALREGILSKRDDALLLPEEANGPDTFYKYSDITYDFQLLFTFYRLQMAQATPEQWVDNLTRLLHDQALTLPAGALKMRFTATHDTIFNLGLMRPRDLFGAPRAQALTALCALIEGVPMLFQGEEDPELYERFPVLERLMKNPELQRREAMAMDLFHRPARLQAREEPYEPVFDFLSRCYQARKEVPALANGGADYVNARATGGVFSCIRGQGADAALVLVALGNEDVDAAVTLPDYLAAVPRWRDVLVTSDEFDAANGLAVSMSPGQARVLLPLP
jgi:glycosidase